MNRNVWSHIIHYNRFLLHHQLYEYTSKLSKLTVNGCHLDTAYVRRIDDCIHIKRIDNIKNNYMNDYKLKIIGYKWL